MKRVMWVGKAKDLREILKGRNEVSKEFEKIPLLTLMEGLNVDTIINKVHENGRKETIYA